MPEDNDLPLDRRSFLKAAAAAGATGLVTVAAPPFVRPAFAVVRSGRPSVSHGVQSGDVTTCSAVVWARADGPARMLVELAATPSFSDARHVRGPLADESGDFTAQLRLDGLAGGRDVFYRVRFADRHDEARAGEPVVGHFRRAPTSRGDVSFVWSGDTAGQGWGINPDAGGMRTYETMRQLSPDLFIHSGDTIYADGPLTETVELPGGSTWRNVVTPEKSKVAETLAEFRGNFRYNLLDDNVRRFNAEVPVLAQWDDHETTNNWYPGEILEDPRYTVTDVDLLAERANQAFHEYLPVGDTPRERGRIYRKKQAPPHCHCQSGIESRSVRATPVKALGALVHRPTAPGDDGSPAGCRATPSSVASRDPAVRRTISW